jgi:hypothetical protein
MLYTFSILATAISQFKRFIKRLLIMTARFRPCYVKLTAASASPDNQP